MGIDWVLGNITKSFAQETVTNSVQKIEFGEA